MEKFTNQMHQMQKLLKDKQSTREAASSDPGMQCFFCKKVGHTKKQCTLFKEWKRKEEQVGKKETLVVDLNKSGLGSETTHPSPKK
jgi:hypothetical protein